MLQELWAKLSSAEKFIVYGCAAVVIGVIIGLMLGSSQVCESFGGQQVCGGSVQYYSAENAGLFALLALLLALVTIAALYVKLTPSINFTWPVPFPQALMILAVATAVCAILVVLMQMIRAGGFGPNPPIFMYLADLLGVAGGVVAAWFAYQAWVASKA